MKKLSVIAMADRRAELLSGLLRLGCVEISEPDPQKLGEVGHKFERSDSRLAAVKADLNGVGSTLNALKRYAEIKDGPFVKRESMSEDEFIDDERFSDAMDVSGAINKTIDEIDRLQTEEGRIRSKIAALEPWADLDIPLEVHGTEHTKLYLLMCPPGTDIEEVSEEIGEFGAQIKELGEDLLEKYSILLCHKDDSSRVFEKLRPYGFSVSTFPGMSGTAKENLASLNVDLKKNLVDQKTAMEKIAVEKDVAPDIKVLSDRLMVESYVQEGLEKLLTDGTVLLFEAWIPAENEGEITAFLDEWGCAWRTEEPAEEEYSDVPIKLKNNWFSGPLNMVTEMYSLPLYGSVDPNPLMAPFFIIFYGIMMADMGYGLLMFIAGLYISKKYSPKGMSGHMFSLATLCGISTFFFGAITGGFFGDFLTQLVLLTTGKHFALPSLFTPLDDTMMVLVGCMALGLVHIVTGMVTSAVMKFRRKQYMDIVWNEITWWIVFAGLPLSLLKITPYVLYAGIGLVVIGPLITGKGIMGKIGGIFGSVYNNVTGYFGDLLSYSRLMALMLSGSVIAQVFNTLATLPGNIIFFLIISAIGNGLNFGLNVLGCYVHDLRLQCLEFFGKFYEDGGRAFKPLSYDTKYVDIK